MVEGDVTPAILAVMPSVPAQPLSLYEPVATPPTVHALVNKALPRLPQEEEKVTLLHGSMKLGSKMPSSIRDPPRYTATVMLSVPNAESGSMERVGGVMVMTTLPTEKPIELVTAVVPT